MISVMKICLIRCEMRYTPGNGSIRQRSLDSVNYVTMLHSCSRRIIASHCFCPFFLIRGHYILYHTTQFLVSRDVPLFHMKMAIEEDTKDSILFLKFFHNQSDRYQEITSRISLVKQKNILFLDICVIRNVREARQQLYVIQDHVWSLRMAYSIHGLRF